MGFCTNTEFAAKLLVISAFPYCLWFFSHWFEVVRVQLEKVKPRTSLHQSGFSNIWIQIRWQSVGRFGHCQSNLIISHQRGPDEADSWEIVKIWSQVFRGFEAGAHTVHSATTRTWKRPCSDRPPVDPSGSSGKAVEPETESIVWGWRLQVAIWMCGVGNKKAYQTSVARSSSLLEASIPRLQQLLLA